MSKKEEKTGYSLYNEVTKYDLLGKTLWFEGTQRAKGGNDAIPFAQVGKVKAIELSQARDEATASRVKFLVDRLEDGKETVIDSTDSEFGLWVGEVEEENGKYFTPLLRIDDVVSPWNLRDYNQTKLAWTKWVCSEGETHWLGHRVAVLWKLMTDNFTGKWVRVITTNGNNLKTENDLWLQEVKFDRTEGFTTVILHGVDLLGERTEVDIVLKGNKSFSMVGGGNYCGYLVSAGDFWVNSDSITISDGDGKLRSTQLGRDGMFYLKQSGEDDFKAIRHYFDDLLGRYFIPLDDYLGDNAVRDAVLKVLESATSSDGSEYWCMTVMNVYRIEAGKEVKHVVLFHEKDILK